MGKRAKKQGYVIVTQSVGLVAGGYGRLRDRETHLSVGKSAHEEKIGPSRRVTRSRAAGAAYCRTR